MTFDAHLQPTSSVTLQLGSRQEKFVRAASDVQPVLAPVNRSPSGNRLGVRLDRSQLSAVMKVVIAASDVDTSPNRVAEGRRHKVDVC